MSTDVSKWADKAMFKSEEHDASTGPRVFLLAMPTDPLGQIAACGKMYKGEVVRDLADVTDAERHYYLEQMNLTKLQMPLEAVTFHFMFENVTRAFTHQLVRQRTAAYAQESMRFAVVEDMNQAVALPPSLAKFNDPLVAAEALRLNEESPDGAYLSKEERAFIKWHETVDVISQNYKALVEAGMPNEDARGLMPTNIVTRVNYITNLRGLLDHAGNRLCTQAQFEWRLVFAQIAKAIRTYSPTSFASGSRQVPSQKWQYEEISKLLKPVCYQKGSCAFGADFDRSCSIRDRVNANASIGRRSPEWDQEYDKVTDNPIVSGFGPQSVMVKEDGTPVFIGAISTVEWLTDPSAAR